MSILQDSGWRSTVSQDLGRRQRSRIPFHLSQYRGVGVVITKEHYPSYAFELPDGVLMALMLVAKKVALLLNRKLDDVGRTGAVVEGFEIDHVHVKLYPLHGTMMDAWGPVPSSVDKYFEKYEGYISSHNLRRADDEAL